jgi:hypothetical protein
MEPLENGSLQLKISNELQEQQYTDMAELWIVTHDKNARVLADEKGNLYNISSTQAPTEAFLNGKKEVSETLLKAGDNMLLYMDDTLSSDAANEVVMKFVKPSDAKNAKILLSLKNSYFLDLLYGELAKGFGNYYGTYIKLQEKKPAAELLKWKLSSGFLFWEIDFAAIDYSEENHFSIQKVTPSKAIDEAGKNILPELIKEDAVYLAQPAIGNTATITYKAAALKDNTKSRTYILHSKGYYEHIRNFTSKPNVAFLNQFKNPGAFPLYGLSLYKQMTRQTLSSLAKTN